MAEEKDIKGTEEAAAEKPAAKKAPAKKAAKPAAKTEAVAEAKADDAKAEKKPAAKKPAAKKAAAKADDKTEAKSDKPAKKPAAKKAPAKKEPVAPAEPTLVRAQARYVRSSARKSRLVVDHIRNQSVEDARVFLQFTARHVGRDVAKVLESAVANAEHNFELDADNLHIVKAYVDEGPTLKRWRPRAKGRATQILKRTSHITVIVSDVPVKELNKRKAAA
jgi:ribosomal protein L22